MSYLILAIDPDVIKSGVAILYPSGGENIDGKLHDSLTLCNLTFPELMSYLEFDKANIKKVVVEAGWLNKKSNFHGRTGQTKAVGERIAKNVGENHAAGKLIAEMAESMGLVVQLVRPTSKKLNSEQFKQLTGIVGRTNQEQRDAGVLCWGMK